MSRAGHVPALLLLMNGWIDHALGSKKAVQLAKDYLSDIMSAPASEVLLEEVELSGDGRFWLVTLSYPAPVPTPILVLTGQGNRVYRSVKLLAETGEFESIKIRALVNA